MAIIPNWYGQSPLVAGLEVNIGGSALSDGVDGGSEEDTGGWNPSHTSGGSGTAGQGANGGYGRGSILTMPVLVEAVVLAVQVVMDQVQALVLEVQSSRWSAGLSGTGVGGAYAGGGGGGGYRQEIIMV